MAVKKKQAADAAHKWRLAAKAWLGPIGFDSHLRTVGHRLVVLDSALMGSWPLSAGSIHGAHLGPDPKKRRVVRALVRACDELATAVEHAKLDASSLWALARSFPDDPPSKSSLPTMEQCRCYQEAEAIVTRFEATSTDVCLDAEMRVNYRDAIDGRPDLNLPRTPPTTLRRWCEDPKAASDLGVNPKGRVDAQQPLVSGLLRLKAKKSTKRQPPLRGKK
jgi:hypothetical protein